MKALALGAVLYVVGLALLYGGILSWAGGGELGVAQTVGLVGQWVALAGTAIFLFLQGQALGERKER